MALEDRKLAFDNICRMMSITKYDIEFHQSINDQSLNIHGENFFRDVFNFVYGRSFINTNFHLQNFPSIDLDDEENKHALQITTTTTREKIDKTLALLTVGKFASYNIGLFYLLNKPSFSQKVKREIEQKYTVKLDDIIFDDSDLIREINNLSTQKIIQLNDEYFKIIADKYTDKIELNLIIKNLIKHKKNVKRHFDDDLGSIETDEKMILNNLNKRLKTLINNGLDYRIIILRLCKDDSALIQSLKEFVINELYREILFEKLSNRKLDYNNLTTLELHSLAVSENLDFNKVIYALFDKLESYMGIVDYNSTNACWIIIAYFFEICDIGRHI